MLKVLIKETEDARDLALAHADECGRAVGDIAGKVMEAPEGAQRDLALAERAVLEEKHAAARSRFTHLDVAVNMLRDAQVHLDAGGEA